MYAFEIAINFNDILHHPLQTASMETDPINVVTELKDSNSSTSYSKSKTGCCVGDLCCTKQPIHVTDDRSEEDGEEDGEEGGVGDENEKNEKSGRSRVSTSAAVNFTLHERVDARDYEGKWYPGKHFYFNYNNNNYYY